MTNLVSVVFLPPLILTISPINTSVRYLFGFVDNHNAFSHIFLIVSCVFLYYHRSSLIVMDWEV